jgi:hypothetical protein
MLLKIKRFFARKRLEDAYYILSYYEKRKGVIGPFEHPFMVVAKSQVRWILKHWERFGLV